MDAGVTQVLIDSDHLAVMCKIRLIVRLKKRSSPRQRLLHLDYSALKDGETRSTFCTKVLESYHAQPTARSNYSRLSAAVTSVSRDTLPHKPKPQPGWFAAAQHTLIPLIQQRNEAMSNRFVLFTRTHTHKLRTARKELKRAVSKAKNNWITSNCNTLNSTCAARGGTKDAWDTVSKLRSGLNKAKTNTERPMKKPVRTVCKTPEENAMVFRDHFQLLYGRQPAFDASVLEELSQHPVVLELLNLEHTPDDEEITKATRKLEDKGPGDPGICPQVWKALIEHEETFAILKSIVVDFCENEIPSDEWETGLLKILAKKGDLSLPGNYRGIMLLETAYKITAIILHD